MFFKNIFFFLSLLDYYYQSLVQQFSDIKNKIVYTAIVLLSSLKILRMDNVILTFQGTFSPTPSVELVHILDRRQSNGSYGPSSLSPVPGVEACKTHGTAIGGHGGNEHCRIKRGIVRHHR